RGERLVELRAVERDLALNVGRETDVEQSLEAAAGLAVLRAENAREARRERAQRRVADERPALRAFGAGAAEIADLCHERIVFRHDVVERLAHAFAILLDGERDRILADLLQREREAVDHVLDRVRRRRELETV